MLRSIETYWQLDGNTVNQREMLFLEAAGGICVCRCALVEPALPGGRLSTTCPCLNSNTPGVCSARREAGGFLTGSGGPFPPVSLLLCFHYFKGLFLSV